MVKREDQQKVERAGIEPASREFDHGYTTSLVGLLFLTRFTLDRWSVKSEAPQDWLLRWGLWFCPELTRVGHIGLQSVTSLHC
jgi:hypothetical protein